MNTNSRMVRYKRKKEKGKNRFVKFLSVVVLLCLLITGVKIVDCSFKDFMCDSQSDVLSIDIKSDEGILRLFGEYYYFDLTKAKRYGKVVANKATDVFDTVYEVVYDTIKSCKNSDK